jgi:hypothetical protein
MKMVIAIRLKKDEEALLSTMSRRRHLNRSDTVKDLMRRGFLMYQLEEYKAGRLSVGKLAANLGLPVLEALDHVARHSAHPDVPDDYQIGRHV